MDSVMTQYRYSSEPNNLRLPKKLVKLALIALVLFSGFSVYQTVGPEYKVLMDAENARKNEVIADQVLYIEGLPPIQLLGDNEFKKVQIEEYIENNIKTQPTYLLRNASMIYLCNLRNLNNHAGDNEGKAFAKETNIYIPFTSIRENTITHELSHVYDYVYSYDYTYHTKYAGTIGFEGIVNSYVNNDASEFMAEASAMHVNNPDSLKTQCPELYNYFASIYAQ